MCDIHKTFIRRKRSESSDVWPGIPEEGRPLGRGKCCVQQVPMLPSDGKAVQALEEPRVSSLADHHCISQGSPETWNQSEACVYLYINT